MEVSTSLLVNVSDCSISYDHKDIIRGVSFGLKRGTITALIGPSGSGKSTLLLAIAGLAPQNARIRGKIEITDSKTPGMVFQKPTPFRLSIFENVALALREKGIRDVQELRERCQASLVRAGLWQEVEHRLNEPAIKLSGGQQQRLCLARSLALEPSLLLLDEPCSSLDPISTRLIEVHLRNIGQQTAILIVTHNLSQARRLSDRVMVLWPEMEGARLLTDEPTEQIFTCSRHELVKEYISGTIG